ncbi:restriction endonuclease subunit S, partial [Clostridia bacterium OttesenSCG-928-F22]|nr:restriction endonuclease subunit S [Clostridia bacterium OttesenSCG-928-F22]
MSEWKRVRLGDVVVFNPESVKKGYPHEIIEYLDIASVGSNVSSGTQSYELAESPGRAKRLVRDGDTIISTVRPNLKTYMKVSDPLDNLVVSTGFAVMRPMDDIDADFLFYSVINQKIIDELSAIADSKTTSYPAVSADDIANICITMPEKIVQKKIGRVLSAYDHSIKNNNRRIAILEEMAQRLYREWFVHFRFPGHENIEMVDSELGMIPEGWEVGKVGDICDRIFSGGTPTTTIDEYWNGDLPWFSSGETRNSFIVDTEKSITKLGVDNSS